MTTLTFVPSTLRVDCLHSVDAALADWQQLQATGHCSAFQTTDWLLPFYRTLAPALGLEPLLLRVSDARSGRPLLLWPLVHSRRHGLRLVQSADAGVADYNGPLLHADWPCGPLQDAPAWHRVWQAAWRQLQHLPGGGAVLQVDKVLPRIGPVPHPLLADQPVRAQAQASAAAGAAGAETMDFNSWALDLPASVAQFQQHGLPAGFAKDLAMRRRRLERKGDVRFALADTPAAREQAFEALVRQRARRFAETGRRDILADPLFRQYYRQLAVDLPGEVVRLFTLQAGDTLVAVLLALDHGGTRHVVIPTFEAGEWKNCSPGNLLLAQAMAHAIAQGLHRFDFTIGDEPYKAGFGASPSPMWSFWRPLSASGWAWVGARQAARGLRNWWRHTVAAAA